MTINHKQLASAGDILVVDDSPENLSFITDLLTTVGYRVRAAINGELALRSVQVKPPALILLDIRMPDMDGFEVCRRLKANAATQAIPIIFASALTDIAEKIKSFELGAVDYVSKPLNTQEVLMRIATHLRLSLTQQQLQIQNNQLREAIEQSECANQSLLATEHQRNDMLERLERSRAALANNEKFLETIIENIPILLEVQDANSLRFVRFNRAGEAMLDLRREELLGRTPQEVFPMEAAIRYIARDQAILAAGVPIDVPEERIQTKSLGERILYTRKIPIFDEKRRPTYLLGISEDVTERRHLEEIRRFGAFQAGIAEMSVSVLHNIGNAITAVTDDAEQILRGVEDLGKVAALLVADAERTAAAVPAADGQMGTLEGIVMRLLAVQREVARVIAQIRNEGLKERAERIGRNVRHIADIVRIQQSAALPGGGAAAFSLQRAVDDALVMQGENLARHEVAITVDLDPSVDEITTHRNRLLQALINVLKNSYEAIRERQKEEHIAGHITITSRPVSGGRLALCITDNGIGIDTEHLQHIFRFGYSTKTRGSGFGLHSVANFVQEQGGTIEARSAGLNQGAELIIELPLRGVREYK
ncbi:hypothetical protein CCP3SC15_3470001 [Gammaproteobacteria bacterium]